MISESTPWKDELVKVATRLTRMSVQKRWTDRSSFIFERDLMVSAYAIRKLLEARKLSDELQMLNVKATKYRIVGEVPDAWNYYEFYESYDLTSGDATLLPIRKVCNEIIHSWLFVISVTESNNEIDGIFVCSDRTRRSYLYHIEIQTLVQLFTMIGNEAQRSVTMARNKRGEMTIIRVQGGPLTTGQLI
jgi:hypothetical protein